MKALTCILFLLNAVSLSSKCQLWNPNLTDSTYRNPVIFADYSDPDVIRVGSDFYMVSSSFNCMPGIPVLHSKDLVNWTIVNHVFERLPLEKFDLPVHGRGTWAPSIRFHNGMYYVYFCTPDDGLFMATAADPRGKWELYHSEHVAQWEDPCPLWDDDGKAYLVRGKVCGHALYIHEMSTNGKKLLDNGTLVYRDTINPTIEGPKFLKKDGYYYILAPAGGVPTGWQTVLRSKNIYGPYEAKKVLHQGNTNINGPHQGALIDLESGEWWFMHFQSRDAWGRIIHMQPVTWKDGWPLMGVDINNDGIGEPVEWYRKPDVGQRYPVSLPQTSDEFSSGELGLQWQWHANPKKEWYSLSQNPGNIRLYAVKNFTQQGNLWYVPNLLLQKFPSPAFTATAKIDFTSDLEREKCGLVIMGTEWAYISIVSEKNQKFVRVNNGAFNKCDDITRETGSATVQGNSCFLRVVVNDKGNCRFGFSTDNKIFTELGETFTVKPGLWIGAKVGVFCINPNIEESRGYADVDWFRIGE